MSAPLWLDRETCSQVALVLWRVTWSGTLLCVVFLLAMRCFARTARARYGLACAALMATLLLVPIWAVVGVSGPVVSGAVASSTEGASLSSDAATLPAGAASSDAGNATQPVAAPSSDSTSPARVATAEPAPLPAPRNSKSPSPGAWDTVVQGVTLAYALGLAAMLVRLVVGVWGGERLRSAGRLVESAAVLGLLADQARRLGLRVVPAIRTCERVAVPVVVGLLRPVVLVPTSMLTGLSPDQLAIILAHELAHLRRHDHLVLLGQRLIETLLFFHPAVWYLSRQIDESREECCDDLVLAHGTDSLEYARSLLRVAELRIGSRAPSELAALSALSVEGASPSMLRRRISRLLGMGTAPVMRLTRTGLAVLLGSLAGLVSLSLVIAGSDATKRPDVPVVRFEDGVELELVGLAQHPSEGKAWWTPDGSPLNRRPSEKFGGSFPSLTPEQTAQCREIWAVVRGASSAVSTRALVDGATQGFALNTTYDNDSRLYTIHYGGGPIPDRKSTRIRISLSLSKDLPLRTFDVTGKKTIPVENQLPPAIRELDDLVRCLEIREKDDMVELVIAPLGSLWDRASIEFLAEGATGFDIRPHESISRQEETAYTFKVRRSETTRIAYRLRPYTHWATFNDVSLEPGTITPLRAEGTIDRSVDINAPTPPAEQAEVLKELQTQGVLFLAEGSRDGRRLTVRLSGLSSRDVPVVSCHLVSPTSESLRLLSRLTDLEELQIMGCRTREGLEAIVRLRKLKRLELINCQWTAADFAILATLQDLESLKTDMHYQLSLDMPWYKKQIPQLSPEQAAFVAHRLELSGRPSVTEMCCYDAFLNDEGLQVLEKLPRLQHLELTNAYLTDAGFRRITALSELRTLNVNGGFLTEEGLRTIANCRHLEAIDIGWGPWSAAALDDLGKIHSLRKVRLWHPSLRVSPATLTQLQDALPEAKVELRQHPEIPPLEFRLVANQPDSELEPRAPADWKTRRFRQNTMERGTEETPGFAWFPIGASLGEQHNIPIVGGKRRALLSDLPEHMLGGDGSWAIEEARVSADGPDGGVSIAVQLDKSGGDQLRKLTEAHQRCRLAIVVGGTIVMAPTINNTIGDRFEITGGFSKEQANDLVAALLKGKKGAPADQASDASTMPNPGTIGERLDGLVELAASGQPLIHVLSDLETRYGVPITMDLREFEARGVSPQTPVTLQISGVSLRNAMKVLLETADPSLDFEANDNGIRIPGRDDRMVVTTQIVSRTTGAPVEGAQVLIEYRDSDWKVQRDTARPSGFQAPLATRQATTDSEGKFRFVLPAICEGRDIAVSRLVAHPDFVVVKAEGYTPLTQTSLKDPAGLQTGFGKISLDPGRLVEGEVRLPLGGAAAGVPVYVAREYVEYVGSPPLSLTDADGRYRVRVPSGDEKYRVYLLPWSPGNVETGMVRCDQPLRRREESPIAATEVLENYCGVSLKIGKPQTLPVVTLEKGVIVLGRVLDASGKGVPNVGVQGDGADSVFRNDDRPLLMARTDKDGLFRLPPIPSGLVIDVRVKDEAWFGPWQARGAILKDVYVPDVSSKPKSLSTTTGNIVLDFTPAPFVTLTARCFTGAEPRTDAHLEFYGFPPGREDTRWRGRFQEVEGQPGVQQLRVPKGLAHAALDLWQDQDERVATSTRLAPAGTPQAGTRVDVRYEVVDSDDASIEIRSPAKRKGSPKEPAPESGKSGTEKPGAAKTNEKDSKTAPADANARSSVKSDVEANSPAAADARPLIVVVIEAPAAETARLKRETRSMQSERVQIHVGTGVLPAALLEADPNASHAEVQAVVEGLKKAGVTKLSISETIPLHQYDPGKFVLIWTRQGSVREGEPEPRTRLAIRRDGIAIVPGDFRNPEALVRLTPPEIESLIDDLWTDCDLPKVSGSWFNGTPDFWKGGNEVIAIHQARRELVLSCQYGWPSGTQDRSIENFSKAVRRLSLEQSIVRAGGRGAIARVIPIVNEGLEKIHPDVSPLEISDFMGAENYRGGSREITFYRERDAEGRVEKVRAAIEVPDEGESNLLSVELNGRISRTERPPAIPGVDLTGVPIRGRWHDIADVYEQRPNEPGEVGRFFRIRPGIRTIDIGKNLEAHILPDGKSFYIEHADHVRRNVYGPIEGNIEEMLKRAQSGK